MNHATMRKLWRDLGGEGNAPLVVLYGLLGASHNWQSAGVDLSGLADMVQCENTAR